MNICKKTLKFYRLLYLRPPHLFHLSLLPHKRRRCRRRPPGAPPRHCAPPCSLLCAGAPLLAVEAMAWRSSCAAMAELVAAACRPLLPPSSSTSSSLCRTELVPPSPSSRALLHTLHAGAAASPAGARVRLAAASASLPFAAPAARLRADPGGGGGPVASRAGTAARRPWHAAVAASGSSRRC